MAGQIRGKNGNFVPKTKLNVVRHHVRSKRLLLPIVGLVAVVGAVVVFTSSASSYRYCTKGTQTYNYTEDCVTKSDEAAVVRMYYATLNRAPDKSGLEFWKNRIANKTTNLVKMADQFIASSEFKRKYGNLSNAAFVNAMYPQVFEREPDAAGAAYWTNRLNSKKTTRAQMIASFVQSPEMMRSFSTRVANALGISPKSYANLLGTVPYKDVKCLGSVKADANGKRWCTVNIAPATEKVEYAVATADLVNNGLITEAGDYEMCYDAISASPNKKNFPARNDLANSMSLTSTTQVIRGFQAGYNPTDKFLCSSIDIVPTLMNTSVFKVSNEQSGSEIGSGSYSFNMDSVRVYKPVVNNSMTYVEEFDANRTTSLGVVPKGATTPLKLRVKGADVTLVLSQYLDDKVSTATTKPHWLHTTDYLKGKQSILFRYYPSSLPSTMQLKVTNANTGAPFTNYKVVLPKNPYNLQEGYKTLDPKQFNLEQYAWQTFSVQVNSSKDVRLRVEVNVISGSGLFASSYIDSGWSEEAK